MTGRPQYDLAKLLQSWQGGNRAALDKLVATVYSELRRLAHFQLARERRGHTLQTTALVNEAYLRLIGTNRVNWRGRAHFLAVSARVMRQVLIQYARLRVAGKRGGAPLKVEFEEAALSAPERDADLIALDDALDSLSEIDSREAKIVELRFFGGLSEEETGHVLGISGRTVRREWEHAKVWLVRELQRGGRT